MQEDPEKPSGNHAVKTLLLVADRLVHSNRYFIPAETLRTIHRVVRRSFPIFNLFVVSRDFRVHAELPPTEETADALSMYIHLVYGRMSETLGEDVATERLRRMLKESLEDGLDLKRFDEVASRLPEAMLMEASDILQDRAG